MSKAFRSRAPRFVTLQAIAIDAMHDLQTSGGFSRNKANRQPELRGFMVSMPQGEHRMVHPSARTIEAYMKHHPLRDGEFWGGWIDSETDGMTVLDVSMQVMRQNDALDLARIFGQRAIYDCHKRENIYLAQPPKQIAHGPSGLRIQGNEGLIGNWYAYDTDRNWEGPRRTYHYQAIADLEAYQQGLANVRTESAYEAMAEIANEV